MRKKIRNLLNVQNDEYTFEKYGCRELYETYKNELEVKKTLAVKMDDIDILSKYEQIILDIHHDLVKIDSLLPKEFKFYSSILDDYYQQSHESTTFQEINNYLGYESRYFRISSNSNEEFSLNITFYKNRNFDIDDSNNKNVALINAFPKFGEEADKFKKFIASELNKKLQKAIYNIHQLNDETSQNLEKVQTYLSISSLQKININEFGDVNFN